MIHKRKPTINNFKLKALHPELQGKCRLIGFGVLTLGFRVRGFGFRVEGLGPVFPWGR